MQPIIFSFHPRGSVKREQLLQIQFDNIDLQDIKKYWNIMKYHGGCCNWPWPGWKLPCLLSKETSNQSHELIPISPFLCGWSGHTAPTSEDSWAQYTSVEVALISHRGKNMVNSKSMQNHINSGHCQAARLCRPLFVPLLRPPADHSQMPRRGQIAPVLIRRMVRSVTGHRIRDTWGIDSLHRRLAFTRTGVDSLTLRSIQRHPVI